MRTRHNVLIVFYLCVIKCGIMKRRLIRLTVILLGIGLMTYGFTEGMQWYRLASVSIGGGLLGAYTWL